MPRVLATACAWPRHRVDQATAAERIGVWLRQRGEDPRRIQRIFANSGVEARWSSLPFEDLFEARGMGARSHAYAEHAVTLAEEAARAALARSGVDARSIALVTSISCTGFLIPSVDAHLVNRLGLGPHVRRLPLTLLGCAGGAMGLAHTADLLRAHPDQAALIVAVELPSQNFQVDDLSMAHLVSSALFGDGAAAVVLGGDELTTNADAACHPRLLASRTHFFEDSLDVMGFDVRDSGFHMVLDARIPVFLDEVIWPEVEAFLADHGTSTAELDHFLVHPGGRAILDALEARIGRGPAAVAPSRALLREYGNLSSASVLALLDRFERGAEPQPGQRGLMLAFGPGFNAEMILLEWSA